MGRFPVTAAGEIHAIRDDIFLARFPTLNPANESWHWTSPAVRAFRVGMILNEEERAGLPRELFALAGRRLEYGSGKAIEGEARDVPDDRVSELSARLHEVGQDIKVIADAIAALARPGARE